MGSLLRAAPPPRSGEAGTAQMVRNLARYLGRGAARSWARNLSGTVPAIASMTLLLIAAGQLGLTGYALWTVAVREIDRAAVLHVYLRDGASPADLAVLRAHIDADPRVAAVGYTDKQQALALAEARPGLGDLAGSAGSNPFPASLDVKLRRVQDIAGLARAVQDSPVVDRIYPTSYNDGYRRLEQALSWLEAAGLAFVLILGLVAVMVTANSVGAAIMARREEVSIMQLVGASRWLVRGPFVVEGGLTGATAGLIAGAVTLMTGLAGAALSARSFSEVLPGLGTGVALVVAGCVLTAGVLLGSASSLVGIHRHLET